MKRAIKVISVTVAAMVLGALGATAIMANTMPEVGRALSVAWQKAVASPKEVEKPGNDQLPPPSAAIAPPLGTPQEQFDEYKKLQEARINDLIDIITVLVDQQKSAAERIELLESNQKTFFSLQEDLRLRFEMLSGGYKRIEADDMIPLDENQL